MKKIIFGLTFIYCVLCRAYNVKQRIYKACDDIIEDPSASVCVDLDLTSKYNDDINYDKCCFFRFRSEGKMTSMCYGLMRNELLDIKEFIDDWERRFPQMKIYDINCNSSYLNIFALGFALFSLLL